ncbi:MAG TPA: helix-turn-helix domain-containing protein [Gemmata sp.]|jgi:hypothetical protein|nr:helix-turn-helix domain-containing protein [Gemmata sp.]
MSLAALGVKPAHVTVDEHFAPWFADIIGRLFNATDFLVNGEAYRFAELEAYYHGPGHFDLFSHRDPVARENGRWYFHRTRGEYRGGSFKGLDPTFGDGIAHFGILIRSIINPNGTLIDGPSLTVDHLLAQTKAKDVATLDRMIDGRAVWDISSPLAIRESPTARTAIVYSSSRVGLSLKKAKGKPEAPQFVARPYRFLTEPQAISKGKQHLVLTLYRLGETPEAIHQITGCPKKTVERYIKDYEAGKAVSGFEGYIGKDLSTADLCKLLGSWAAKYGG